jgi:hypothetical protein
MPAFKDVSRYRSGDRDDQARAAHTADTTSWRHGIAEVVFTGEDQQLLLDRLREGWRMRAAAAAVGLSFQAVYGRASWDGEFRDALEEVLATTCPAEGVCGTASGVKHGGHCAACRSAHHPPRSRIRLRR